MVPEAEAVGKSANVSINTKNNEIPAFISTRGFSGKSFIRLVVVVSSG